MTETEKQVDLEHSFQRGADLMGPRPTEEGYGEMPATMEVMITSPATLRIIGNDAATILTLSIPDLLTEIYLLQVVSREETIYTAYVTRLGTDESRRRLTDPETAAVKELFDSIQPQQPPQFHSLAP